MKQCKWQHFKANIIGQYTLGRIPAVGVCMEDIDRNHVFIPLESWDMSHGTGNVIAHVTYDVNDRRAYKYADL